MNIIEVALSNIIPYENNPRDNAPAVDAVAASIREFGFKNPIIIDKDNVIVAGHTRALAAEKLGLEVVPCIRADDLTDEQIRAYRLADNKTAELAEWDLQKLDEELAALRDIDMSAFGFEDINDGSEWFENREHNDTDKQEGNDEYNEFLDKFEVKKTTDDCYTPDNIYNTVAEYVSRYYGLNKKGFVRPFYPGGNYQKFLYKKTSIVVDNPPFSILSEIRQFYNDKGIKYFLFAPSLTGLSSSMIDCYVAVGGGITYENGACVATSFVTNLEEYAARTAPDLYDVIQTENDKNLAEMRRQLPKYEYPDNVITAAKLQYYAIHHTEFKIGKSDCCFIRALDVQKEQDKGIFGGAYLLSEKAAAEKAAAEKAAAEKAAAEKAAAKKWELSEREWQIVRDLSR